MKKVEIYFQYINSVIIQPRQLLLIRIDISIYHQSKTTFLYHPKKG